MNKGFILFGSLFIVFSLFLLSGYSQEDPEDIIDEVAEKLKDVEIDDPENLENTKIVNSYYEKYSESSDCKEKECVDKFYEEVMDRSYMFDKEGEFLMTSWAASQEKGTEKSSEYKQKESELYLEIGDSIKDDQKKLEWYEEGIKTFEIDYENLEESVSSMQDALNKAYDSSKKKDPDEFYDYLSPQLEEDKKAMLDLWMSRQDGVDEENKIKCGQDAADYFSEKASGLEEEMLIEKANLYQLAADSLPKPSADAEEGYTIEDYEEERDSYLVDSYYYRSQYYTLEGSNAESYYAKRDLFELLDDLPEDAEGKESGVSVEEVKEEITKSLSSGEEFSWIMKDTFDAINLGKSISEKMYENFAFYRPIEDWFDKIFSKVYDGMDETTIGKILTGQFEDLLCANVLKVHGETPVLATEDGKLGSFVAGQRQIINNPDGSVKYLYKVTYKIDPAFGSNTKKTNLTIQVYDNNGEPYYLDLNDDRDAEDPHAPYILEKFFYTPKNQPLAWYSDMKFEKVCVEFYDVDAFISDFKYLLKGNDNKICADIADVEPIYIEEEQSYHDSSGTSYGGESSGEEEEYKCANC